MSIYSLSKTDELRRLKTLNEQLLFLSETLEVAPLESAIQALRSPGQWREARSLAEVIEGSDVNPLPKTTLNQ